MDALPSRATREVRMCAIEAASRTLKPAPIDECDAQHIAEHIKLIAYYLEQSVWEPIEGRGDRND